MNSAKILQDLFSQLKTALNELFTWLSVLDFQELGDDEREEAAELIQRVEALFSVMKQQANRVKLFAKKSNEFMKMKYLSEGYDKQLETLSGLINQSLCLLSEGNGLVSFTSMRKDVSEKNFRTKDLVNFTLRVNSNYKSPAGLNGPLPHAYDAPYPRQDFELKHTFLKFDLDCRLQEPVLSPRPGSIKQNAPLVIKYPDSALEGVFFRLLRDPNDDTFPTYFNGEIYDANNPPKLSENTTIKVCSCKHGLMDSKIFTASYIVTADKAEDTLISEVIRKPEYLDHLLRVNPFSHEDLGYVPLNEQSEDNVASVTPGSSLHQTSFRKANSYLDNVEEEDL